MGVFKITALLLGAYNNAMAKHHDPVSTSDYLEPHGLCSMSKALELHTVGYDCHGSRRCPPKASY